MKATKTTKTINILRNRLLPVTSLAVACGLLAPSVFAQSAAGGVPWPRTPGAAPRVSVPAPVDPRLGPQAFSVVLVVGEMQDAQSADSVPAAARKALTDLKDFLPYRSYRLLDSQWTLCCGRQPVFSRLRGLDDQDYELQLTPSIQSDAAGKPAVSVRFYLAETSGTAEQSAELRKAIEALRRRSEPGATPDATRVARIVELEQAVAAASRRSQGRTVMDASFRMDVGETVVVGTSRIQGDKALIALLTAVPPKK